MSSVGEHSHSQGRGRWRRVMDYVWFILKNVLGYVFIALAAVMGPLPGPGGIVFFLIGFSLIWFPGKRHLTARVLRGIPFRLHRWTAHLLALLAALALTPAALWWFTWRKHAPWPQFNLSAWREWLVWLATAGALWVIVQGLMRVGNAIVRFMPRIRRRIRPWLRHHGIDLLPPRLRQRLHHPDGSTTWSKDEGGIVRIRAVFRERIRSWLGRSNRLSPGIGHVPGDSRGRPAASDRPS